MTLPPIRKAGLLNRLIAPLTVIVTVAVNGAATALPLNGRSTAEISNSFPVVITPPGFVFAVWGIIYMGLIGYSIFQALPSQAANPRLRAVAPWFLANGIANTGWLFLWHYGFHAVTFAAMLAVLATLVVIYLQLRSSPAPLIERVLVQGPFSIYLGWILVATLVNGGVLGWELGWQAVGPTATWVGILLLAVGLGVNWGFAWNFRDWAIPLVLVWATYGISVLQRDGAVLPTLTGERTVEPNSLLATAALAVMGLAAAAALSGAVRHVQAARRAA
jgi:benzodiazapine receptor